MANKNLHAAKDSKNDEFYTQLEDIEKELSHYKHHFKGKVVFCNCDDPYESNFFKYFALNFNHLGLKKLIATSFIASPVAFGDLPLGDCFKPYKIELDEVYDENGDGATDITDVKEILEHAKRGGKMTQLKGDGDFRRQESIELLKQADIVVTNPPFSLFREYVAQLTEFDKKFLILGNKNALTYKDIFALFKSGEIWIGYNSPKNFLHNGKITSQVNGLCRWFTNLDIKKRHEDIFLVEKYDPLKYPKYDNYDAIEVSKVKDIPRDYDGVMGVPITFLDKFNPEQFEILGMCENEDLYKLKTKIYDNEEKKRAYFVKFGRKGQYDLNASGVVVRNGRLEKVYQRILIKNKKARK